MAILRSCSRNSVYTRRISMRMRRSLAAFASAALLLTGAGCLGGGSSKAATGGMWLSADAGKTWTAKNVLPTPAEISSISSADILTIEVDPQDESAIYAGTRTAGLLYTLDGGASWMRPESELAKSGAVLDVEVSAKSVCTVYVLKADRLMKTTTCGRTFDENMYVEGRSDEALTAMAIDWYNPNVVYLGTTAGEILKSSDGGSTWTTVQRTKSKDAISAIEVSNADSRYVMMGGTKSGMYRSEDAGISWVALEDSMDDFKNSDRVYGLTQTADGSTVLMSSKYGLLASTDKGLTWSSIALVSSGNDVTIMALSVDPDSAKTIMYGTETAIYRSDDGGKAWATSELPSTRAASALKIMKDGTILLGVRSLED